jgi:hypothetical protein
MSRAHLAKRAANDAHARRFPRRDRKQRIKPLLNVYSEIHAA